MLTSFARKASSKVQATEVSELKGRDTGNRNSMGCSSNAQSAEQMKGHHAQLVLRLHPEPSIVVDATTSRKGSFPRCLDSRLHAGRFTKRTLWSIQTGAAIWSIVSCSASARVPSKGCSYELRESLIVEVT